MKELSRVLVVGDVHGRFTEFRQAIEKLKPEMVLSTGDFGYWPDKYNIEGLWDDNQIPIYFCDGNHEDHSVLKNYDEITEIADNVFYMPRGSTLQLPNGMIVLFMGGAVSIDRDIRCEGLNYFIEEELTYDDLPAEDLDEVDIVISHTKPTGIDIEIDIVDDASMEVLDEVFEMYRPHKWYFSHFHIYKFIESDNCKWYCLNMFNDEGWYEWL